MYNESIEADCRLGKYGKSILNQVISIGVDYGISKLAEAIDGQLSRTGGSITLNDPSKNSRTQVMYRLVDNSTSYDEFQANREKYDIQLNLSIDRPKNKNSIFDTVMRALN